MTQAPAWGWLTRFRRCLSISEERREESKEKEASCWEVQGSGEEDQPNFTKGVGDALHSPRAANSKNFPLKTGRKFFFGPHTKTLTH